MKIIEIDKFLTDLAGEKRADEGLLSGEADREVNGILISWMPTLEVLSVAVKKKCNLVICHEELLFPYLKERNERLIKQSPTWVSNRKRLEIIRKNKLCVIRAHYRADEKFNIDGLAGIVGLPEAIECRPMVRIYGINQITLKKFAKNVKEKLKIDKIKVIGDLDFPIKRLGIAVGGMSLGVCLDFMEDNYVGKCDTILAGEADEYARFYAEESKLNLILTGHAFSENIGLKTMANFLKKQFPDIPIFFFENKLPGKYI